MQLPLYKFDPTMQLKQKEKLEHVKHGDTQLEHLLSVELE
jgi:hypothetical protein